MSFHLTKWYFDCVTSEGSAFIGYWARLRWRSLHLHYAAALIAPVTQKVREVTSIRSPAAPTMNARCCTWHCPQIGVSAEWHSVAPPLAPLLLRTEHGRLRWSCVQPRASASVVIADDKIPLELKGIGYAERLDLTIAPWRLPFDTLFWGRFLSDEHALVWLEWRDTRGARRTRRRYANLDGITETTPAIEECGVRLPSLSARLAFCESTPLRHGTLVHNVLGAIPVLNRMVPATFQRAHEAKSLSASQLHLSTGAVMNGWSIHEVVRW